MEQLILLIQQIYRVLNILSNYSPKEREELLEGYQQFLFEIENIVIVLNRIVEGSTSWGFLPWQLRTYQQQRGLTLQADWEDRVDFGLDLYRDLPVEPQRILVPIGPPEVSTPEDLEFQEVKPKVRTDICQTCHIRHERPVVFHEVISSGSSSFSDTGNPNEAQELPEVERDSDLDSMPELEDVVDIGTIEIPLWLIPNGVSVTFRGRRAIFEREEREQGLPWQEVLAQMLEEQELEIENS